MPSPSRSIAALKSLLEECGYRGACLKEDFTFGATTIPLAGFATKPLDFDSACIAVTTANGNSEAAARSCKDMGAPIVWVHHNGTVEWWKQRATRPTPYATRPAEEFRALVLEHREELVPASVYRGKTIARVDTSRQLDFIDAGLLPLLREEAGKKLHGVVEDMIRTILDGLNEKKPGKDTLHKAFMAAFRLLAGKILKDKCVPGFEDMDLSDPMHVLAAVGDHYSAGQSEIPIHGRWERALTATASVISSAPDFSVVSPETLAYVYEHALVTKALRRKLGIHATPPWLVDYMVWRIYDWICEIPEDNRHVFEPACGHAPFLLSAMRLLRLEIHGRDEKGIHDYLKAHIHGLEIDDFAREIARLSLTLADIPNPDGWDLGNGDMYASDVLSSESAKCGILLCNPPYEQFDEDEKKLYAAAGFPTKRPKAIELMERTLRMLPERAIFALLLPQGILHGSEARATREILLRDYDIREICLFADKVFAEGEPESVVVLGRRRKAGETPARTVQYRRVHKGGIKRFATTYNPDSQFDVGVEHFESDPQKSFRVPDLLYVWTALLQNPKLSSVADVGQGFSFAEKGLLTKARARSKRKTADGVRAFIDGHAGVNIWTLPKSSWVSPAETPVKPWRSGFATGKPQVLINYVRAMRGPYRIKAFIDNEGHATINTYSTVRPKPAGPPIKFLWAVLNSPIGNAYAYCYTMQRHIYDSLIGTLPLPMRWKGHVRAIVDAANAYLEAAKSDDIFSLQPDSENAVRDALIAMDAAVLRAYDLPPQLERQLLDLFTGVKRKGVGCNFTGYYPSGYTSYLPLHFVISGSFQRAAADATADRFRCGESEYVRDVLSLAAATDEN